jgi:hypothetical protein
MQARIYRPSIRPVLPLLRCRFLYIAARRGLQRAPEIAERYTDSEQMAAFRLRTTGVLRQLGAS